MTPLTTREDVSNITYAILDNQRYTLFFFRMKGICSIIKGSNLYLLKKVRLKTLKTGFLKLVGGINLSTKKRTVS